MNRRRFLFSSTASLGLFATTPSQSLTPPPSKVQPLSHALMQGLNEACLRLTAKALQSQLNSEDFQDASLWFEMAGQHFIETDYDSVFRTAASKILDRIKLTGIPLDYSSIDSDLIKELSSRVGWNVEDQIKSIYRSTPDEDMRYLQDIEVNGLSTLMIAGASTLARLAQTMPAKFMHDLQQPSLHLLAYNGYQSSTTYPPPAPRPPLISVTPCHALEGISVGANIAALYAQYAGGCMLPNPLNAEYCVGTLGLNGVGMLAGMIAYLMNC